MSLLSNIKDRMQKEKGYLVYVNCPNCGARGEITVTKGISVSDYVKQGRCKCETCAVIFHPKEYSTKFFDEIEKREKAIKELAHLPKPTPKPKQLNDFKEGKGELKIW